MNILKRIYKSIRLKIRGFLINKKRKKSIEKILQTHSIAQDKKEEIIRIINGTSVLESKKQIELLSNTKEEIKEIVEIYTELELISDFNEKGTIDKSIANEVQLRKDVLRLNNKLFELTRKQSSLSVFIEIPVDIIDKYQDLINLKENRYINNTNLDFDLTAIKELEKTHSKINSFFAKSSLVEVYKTKERAKLEKQKKFNDSIKQELRDAENLLNKSKLNEAESKLSNLMLLLKDGNSDYFIKEVSKLIDKVHRRRDEEIARKRKAELVELRKQAEAERLLLEEANKILENARLEKIAIQREKEDKEIKRIEELNKLLEFKESAEEIKNYLNANGIDCLYHFTDRKNIESIIKHGGLYSWYYCDQNSIYIPASGGDQLSRNLDSKKKLKDFVRLCFNKSHPMLFVAKRDGRINEEIILEIDPIVCLWKNSKYSNGNAASNNFQIGTDLNALKAIDLRYARSEGYFDNGTMEHRHKQSEVLVKSWIPISFIKNINIYK
jgi:hypothetical protein